MNERDRIEQLLDAWESGEQLTAAELDELRTAAAHTENAATYRQLLHFVERDSHTPEPPPRQAPVSGAFTDRVMGRIANQRAERRVFPSRQLTAVVAVLLVLVGSAVGLFIGRSSAAPNRVVVRFQLAAPKADSVTLVGDFSDWESDRYPLEDEDSDGVWEITIPLEQGQVYTYNFLIDGNTWVTDPDSLTTVDDGFGGEKSVLNL